MQDREIVIGADGFIGARLRALAGAEGTSRRNPTLHGHHYLDLAALDDAFLPDADIVYVCAGVNGTKTVECDPCGSWAINVDARLRLYRHYTLPAVTRRGFGPGAFVVFISSTTVEWSGGGYARQHAQLEAALFCQPSVAIVRAGRVTRENLDDLCTTLLLVGRERLAGIHFWNRDEQPYAK